ncbi:MAG: FAD-dependent monooxygenase [Phycisphaeraceae bacterium]
MDEAAVVIIGGGPAGAVCAAALARRGLDVLLVEARAFPRAKVCGEFLSPVVMPVLSQYVDAQALGAAGARRVDRLHVYGGGERKLDWPMPRWAWSLSRGALDSLLLEHARACGANVLQPATVRQVSYHDDHVQVRLDDRAIRARCVVHADGHGRFDPAGATAARRGVVGLKCHLRLHEPIGNALQLHGFSGPLSLPRETPGRAGMRVPVDECGAKMQQTPPVVHEGAHAALLPGSPHPASQSLGHPLPGGEGRAYLGVVSVERGLATAAMVVSHALIKHFDGDHDALLRTVAPSLASARRQGDWLTCPVASSWYIRPGHPRSFRIGNAAAAVEPVAGEGIGLAVWSGDLLGRLLEMDRLGQTQAILGRAYRRRLLLLRPAAAMMAALLARPWLWAPIAPLLSRLPGVALRPLYCLSGKSGGTLRVTR